MVTDYLEKAGLNTYLDKLGFNLVGYGCTTCIGNSGPLPENIVDAIQKENVYAVSVLSGNRNFEGRISPHIPRCFTKPHAKTSGKNATPCLIEH